MTFADGALTFQEFAMNEPVPLATIHAAVMEFLQGRSDAVLFGALAVNAYVEEPRMTQDVDIMTTRGRDFAEELARHLGERFHIAVRIREVAGGKGLRIYQSRKPQNRHLVDVRPVDALPPSQLVEKVAVLTPEELVASKVVAYHGRRGQPKSFTDLRDLAMLWLQFPALKSEDGPVRARLEADDALLATWHELIAMEFQADEDY